jgi:hypothetical protein
MPKNDWLLEMKIEEQLKDRSLSQVNAIGIQTIMSQLKSGDF